MADKYQGPPADLDSLRALGVHSLEAFCGCGRRAVIDAAGLPGGWTVPSFYRRLRCAGCGARPVDVRPHWLDQTWRGSWERE